MLIHVLGNPPVATSWLWRRSIEGTVVAKKLMTQVKDQALGDHRFQSGVSEDLDEGGRLLLAQETLTANQFPAIRPVTKQPETVG